MSRLTRRTWLANASAASAGLLATRLPAAATGSLDGMILIPAGPFPMGTGEDQIRQLSQRHGCHPDWLAGESPQRVVTLPACQIDKFPVTNRLYQEFCAATGHPAPDHWRGPRAPADLLDHPVVRVSRADARAFAAWAGKRLPSEAEWEKAARGAKGLLYPWGDEFDPEACHWSRNATVTGTAPVDSHPRGASPYGVMDMTGNAAEWCADSPGAGYAFIKGGGWVCASPLSLRPAVRSLSGAENNRLDFIGFRCAKDA